MVAVTRRAVRRSLPEPSQVIKRGQKFVAHNDVIHKTSMVVLAQKFAQPL
jgi:hypothetical protein